MNKKYTYKTAICEIGMILLTILYAAPFYLLISNSLKTTTEAYSNPFGLPQLLNPASYTDVLNGAGMNADFAMGLVSSLSIAAFSIILLIVLGSLAAYGLSRHPGKMSNALYILFVVGIIVPSQLGIVPIYTVLRSLRLTGNIAGAVILYVCKQMPMTVFLYTGFFRQLPKDFEEAANIDGSNWFKTYWQVVMPQMNTITGTVILMNAIYIWNDTFDQIVFLSGSKVQTLPVLIYTLTTAMTAQWNIVFAAVVISLLPMVVLYLFTQKKMMSSLAGGIKG